MLASRLPNLKPFLYGAGLGGVTCASIGHLVAELTAAGLVLETPSPTPKRLTQPGVAVQLNQQWARFIGITMDTRATSGVLLELNMKVLARRVHAKVGVFSDPQAMLPLPLTFGMRLWP